MSAHLVAPRRGARTQLETFWAVLAVLAVLSMGLVAGSHGAHAVAPAPVVGPDRQVAFGWGSNVDGNLGTGGYWNSSVPVAVDPSGPLAGKTVAEVAAGRDTASSSGDFACALTSDSVLACWGKNSVGLGDGTTTSSPVPVAVDQTGVLSGLSVSSLSAGKRGSACATTSDGQVACWGHAPLGNGSVLPSPIPVLVDATGSAGTWNARGTALGETHGCLWTADGAAACWGFNGSGQLGNGTNLPSAVPVAVDTAGVLAGRQVAQVAAGDTFACAVTTDGTLACWGDNAAGQLGDGTNTESNVPVAVNTSGVLAGRTATSVTAGDDFACATLDDGTAACWGANDNAQLGSGSFANSNVPVSVQQVGALAGRSIGRMSAGSDFTCALATDGMAACWGLNAAGQLGDASTTPSATPVGVAASGSLNGRSITQLSASGSYVMAAAVPRADAPTGLVATPGNASASVAFVAPTATGELPILNYEVSTDNGATWSARTPPSTTSPVDIAGLTNGVTYQVRLRAVTAAGPGAPSAAAAVLPRTVADAPTGLAATPADRSAAIAFTAPLSNGGLPITNYSVSTDDGATWTALSPPSTSSPIIIEGLTNSTAYLVRLRAVTAAGDGAVSDSVSVTPGVPPALNPMAPVRVADTRPGSGVAYPATKQMVGAGQTLVVPVAGQFGVPADAPVVSLNVTATNPTASGFLTLYPCGKPRPTASSLNFLPGQTVPNAVVAAVGDNGSVCVYSLVSTDVIVDLNGWLPADGGYRADSPVRVADTRQGTAVSFPANKAAVPAGGQLEVPIAGQYGVPADAATASLNVIAVAPTSAGFLTVYPCGSQRPTASNLNFVAGQVVANAVMIGIGTGGNVCVYSSAEANIVVDMGGWMPPAAGFTSVVPVRIADTRSGQPVAFPATKQPLAPGETLQIPTAGANGVPGNASAVSLNVTAVNPAAGGYLTVYPCGATRPTASNVNYQAGQVIPNAVLTGVGTGGMVCVYSSAQSDVVVDLNGWFPPPMVTGPAAAILGR